MIDLEALASATVGDADDLAAVCIALPRIGTPAEAKAEAFLSAARLIGETAEPVALVSALDGMTLSSTIDRIGALVMRCFAAVRVDYPSRPDAQSSRAKLSFVADAAYQEVGETYGAAVHGWLTGLVGIAVESISAIAATRAPLVRVETGLSLPSSIVAFDLYGDPSRGAELVLRNRTGTPMLMPAVMEAAAA